MTLVTSSLRGRKQIAATPTSILLTRRWLSPADNQRRGGVDRASAASQEISSLERAVAGLEGKLVAAQNEEAVAKAGVDRLESTLNLLSAKIVEAQMAHSLNLGETTISVVSPAMEPKNPVKPRKIVNMAVAGVLGGFVSLLLVFVLEYMDNTIKTADDVQKYLNTGTLGTIPLIDGRKRRKK